MELREEYQQLEAINKMVEERCRKLNLISVGVIDYFDNFFIPYAAYYYHTTGKELKDAIDSILSDFRIIHKQQESFIEGYGVETLLNSDEYKTLENPIRTVFYSKFLLVLDFIIVYLKDISKHHLPFANLCDKEINDFVERIDKTITQCEDIISICKDPSVDISTLNIDIIRKYQHYSFSKKRNTFQELKKKLLIIKQTRGLSDSEYEQFLKEWSNKEYCFELSYYVISLIIYLLLLDDNPKYVQLVTRTFNQLPEPKDSNLNELTSNHTIEEIFILIKKLPKILVKNLLLYFKEADCDIDTTQFSSIIDAISYSDLNMFKSSITKDVAKYFDLLYNSLELIYSIILVGNSRSKKEHELSTTYFGHLSKQLLLSHSAFRAKLVDDNGLPITNKDFSIPLIEYYLNNAPITLGFFTYFYKKHRSLLHPEDRIYFDQIFTQEPYKSYCEKALSELDKYYPDNKTFFKFMNGLIFGFRNSTNEVTDKHIYDVQAEDIQISESMGASDMKPNPFGGLNPDAILVCNGDKRGYVGMFIDYIIDRGYINSEYKDSYVSCLCDDMITESAIDNLKHKDTNKEGVRNSNIVTLLFGRLTRFTANNGIVVNGKVISGGGIYFNKRQIDNGELEEWCLFWPFLTGRNKEGKEEFKKLFQGPLRSQDSKMESALKRVTSFIEDYEAAKSQNPSITKLEFIKKRH